MPPGMPDTSVKHMRLNLSPCLLQLPGELLDAGNCLQLVWRSPTESPRGFQWNWPLCRSQVKHLAPRKEQVVGAPILHLFGRAQEISTGHEDSLLAFGKIMRVVNVTSRS